MKEQEETKELPRGYWKIVREVHEARFEANPILGGAVNKNVFIRVILVGMYFIIQHSPGPGITPKIPGASLLEVAVDVDTWLLRPPKVPGGTLYEVALDILTWFIFAAIFVTATVIVECLVVGLWRWWWRRKW